MTQPADILQKILNTKVEEIKIRKAKTPLDF